MEVGWFITTGRCGVFGMKIMHLRRRKLKKLKNFPAAQYAHGMRAWSRGDARKASEFFRQAVSEDPFYMDAWLRLAESEVASGHPEKSRRNIDVR